jgi:hypothetical protein
MKSGRREARTCVPFHFAEARVFDPVFTRRCDLLMRAADEVPPHQDSLAEWPPAEDQNASALRGEGKLASSGTEVVQHVGNELLAVESHVSFQHEHGVFEICSHGQ